MLPSASLSRRCPFYRGQWRRLPTNMKTRIRQDESNRQKINSPSSYNIMLPCNVMFNKRYWVRNKRAHLRSNKKCDCIEGLIHFDMTIDKSSPSKAARFATGETISVYNGQRLRRVEPSRVTVTRLRSHINDLLHPMPHGQYQSSKCSIAF